MVIDIHAHLWGRSIDETKKEICQAAKRCSIDRVYVSGLQSYDPQPEEIDFLNSAVAEFMRQEPALIGGAVYANPKLKNALPVIRQGIEEQGFSLIKLWCAVFADDQSVDPIMEYAESVGVPVLFHAFHKATAQVPNESTACHVARIARRHPKTKIIMAHFGGNAFHGIPAVRDLHNLWCDHSGTPHRSGEIAYAARHLGADRILFGTDNAFATNLGKVQGAALTNEEKDCILFKNAQQILDRSFRL